MTVTELIAELQKWESEFGHLPVLRDTDGAPAEVGLPDLWNWMPSQATGVRLVSVYRNKKSGLVVWEAPVPSDQWEKRLALVLK